MRTYELFCLLKSGFDIESNDQVITNIEKQIVGMGGKVVEINKAGRKKLAYEIDSNRDAFCVVYTMEMEPEKVKELKRYLKLNEVVLREYITAVKATKKAAVA